MKFGNHARKLLEALHIQMKIIHQFESGDFVPEAGGSHLGTTDFHPWKDQRWLDSNITVFRPLKTATALSIVTAPTHGRRIGTAVAERDYVITEITPSDLAEYDHSRWLSGRIAKIWGYRFFNSPRTSEMVRRNVSRLLAFPLKIFNFWIRKDAENKDEKGVSWQGNLLSSRSPKLVHN